MQGGAGRRTGLSARRARRTKSRGYSRPRQTMADQSILKSAVLPASPMPLLAPQSGALRISAYRDFLPIPSIPLIAFEHLSLSMVIRNSASRPRQINVDQVTQKQVSFLRNFSKFSKLFQIFQNFLNFPKFSKFSKIFQIF